MRFTLSIMMMAMTLGACDTTRSLQQLRHAPMQGSAFDRALAAEYQRYAEDELKAYDWWSSKYFADKGMVAAYGRAVPPESLEHWRVRAPSRPALEKARQDLIAKLTPDYLSTNPEQAAKTQAAFDCWLEQEDEADEDGASFCRRRFEDLMGRGIHVASFEAEDAAPRPAPAVRAKAPAAAPVVKSEPMGGPLSSSYLLYFGWDSSALEGMARDELAEMASGLARQKGSYQVVINGHADRSGEDDYNMALSQERADMVREFLLARGIAKDNIAYYAFGESDPKATTEDGQKSRVNRRVEIFIE